MTLKSLIMLSLEQLLDGLDIEVEPFALCSLRGRSHLALDRRETASLHYTLYGQGRALFEDGTQYDLQEGSLMVVQPGISLRLETPGASPADTRTPEACRALPIGWLAQSAGQGEESLLLACANLSATYQARHGLFDYLPEPLLEQLADGDPLRSALSSLLQELARPRPGTHALARALMQQSLILLLRRHCASGSCKVSWLTALEDERLGRALSAMVDRPEAPHSLESLAGLAGMSRSSFANHFTQAFGRGPIDMLKELRLRRAARLLSQGSTPVKELAHSVGYESRSYFTRAFKAFFGLSPLAYREEALRAIQSPQPPGA